ncbi:antitoxin [archaeon]|nr:antitoxin [archaeon]
MVQALVELDENTNRVLNMVKAKYCLKDKGEAITFVVTEYIEEQNEPELRPEFIKKIKKIQKQKSIRIKDFAKHYGLKNV